MHKKEGAKFTPKYLKILGYGGSEAPAKILAEAGIDIERLSQKQQFLPQIM
jgi:oligoendopeptidase F